MNRLTPEQRAQLGKALGGAREARGLSQRSLAVAAGMSHVHLGRIEQGEQASDRAIAKLLEALQLSGTDLVPYLKSASERQQASGRAPFTYDVEFDGDTIIDLQVTDVVEDPWVGANLQLHIDESRICAACLINWNIFAGHSGHISSASLWFRDYDAATTEPSTLILGGQSLSLRPHEIDGESLVEVSVTFDEVGPWGRYNVVARLFPTPSTRQLVVLIPESAPLDDLNFEVWTVATDSENGWGRPRFDPAQLHYFEKGSRPKKPDFSDGWGGYKHWTSVPIAFDNRYVVKW